MSYTLVTVQGKYLDPITGDPAVGRVEWYATSPIVDGTNHITLNPPMQSIVLDANGMFSVQLLPMDTAGLNSGWAWAFKPYISGVPGAPQYMTVNLSGAPVGGWWIDELPVAVPVTQEYASYALQSALTTEVTRAEAAEATVSTAVTTETSRAEVAEAAALLMGMQASSGDWLPSDDGYLAANFDPLTCAGSNANPSAGIIYFTRIPIRTSIMASNLHLGLNNAGSGTSTGCFGGLLSSSGVPLAASNDVGSKFNNASLIGDLLIPFTSSVALSAGTYVWGMVLSNLSGGQPSFYKNSADMKSANLSAAGGYSSLRVTRSVTGSLTALPPSQITPASYMQTGGEIALWMAIS